MVKFLCKSAVKVFVAFCKLLVEETTTSISFHGLPMFPVVLVASRTKSSHELMDSGDKIERVGVIGCCGKEIKTEDLEIGFLHFLPAPQSKVSFVSVVSCIDEPIVNSAMG